MKHAWKVILLLGAGWLGAGLAARPADAGVGDLVDKVRQRLAPVLLTRDLLVKPGEEVTLTASLRTGLRLEGLQGKRLQFSLEGEDLGQAITDDRGDASVPWKAPKVSDYRVRVRVHPDDQPEKPAEETTLFVAARPAEARIVVVDLDKTLVESSFLRVLVGGAKPMAGSAVVMQRLAADHTIIYLTHRPDFLGPSSKAWLTEHRFPPGPVLTSTLGTFVEGSGTYKTARIEALKRSFPNVVLGIGDKFSDVRAYADNGLRSILVLHIDWSEDDPADYDGLAAELAALPEGIHAVTNWSEVAEIVFQDRSYPTSRLGNRLRDAGARLRRAQGRDGRDRDED